MIAEIRGKISHTSSNLTERLEDHLTGNVFGSLRYLPFSLGKEINPLTERESEILFYLSEGHSVREISKFLYLSPGTIRNYISKILQKLEAKNRIDAIVIAQRKGWINH